MAQYELFDLKNEVSITGALFGLGDSGFSLIATFFFNEGTFFEHFRDANIAMTTVGFGAPVPAPKLLGTFLALSGFVLSFMFVILIVLILVKVTMFALRRESGSS